MMKKVDIPQDVQRCSWCTKPTLDPLYVDYHDNVWGNVIKDDQEIFEFLLLESFQAGLSWLTILRKRENFRRCFAQFNPEKVAKFTEKKIEKLMQDSGIIRHKGKILAAINNAKLFCEIQKQYGSFSHFIWAYVDHKPIINKWKNESQIPSQTPLSLKISKDLKALGFKFMGPTIVYSHMQATGMVFDHVQSCFRYKIDKKKL